jgi:hypothetical protein
MAIDGVECYCISPEESIQNSYSMAYHQKLTNPEFEVPDPNSLSAVLALKFGQGVVLLGADALKKNWQSAIEQYRKHNLPKAMILKVPHHGAKNALETRGNAASYLDLCSYQPKAKSVIFAGDSKHPNDDVFEKLMSRTETICLSNGRKMALPGTGPLKLQLPGARPVLPAPVCNPVVSLTVDAEGNVTSISGGYCKPDCLS